MRHNNGACNKHIRATRPSRQLACMYAYMVSAAWRHRRPEFEDFPIFIHLGQQGVHDASKSCW